MSVIIGINPHKRSATIEVVDEDGRRLPVGQPPPNGEAWPASAIPDGADLSAHPPAGRHHSVVHLSALQPQTSSSSDEKALRAGPSLCFISSGMR